MPIVTRERTVDKRCAPDALKESSHKVRQEHEAALEFPSPGNREHRLPIPTFRDNFRFHLKYTCGCTDGEISYVLGYRPPDTDYTVYNDMLSWANQKQLLMKIARWTSQFGKEKPLVAKTRSGFKRDHHEKADGVYTLAAEIPLDSNTDRVTVIIPYGGTVMFKID